MPMTFGKQDKQARLLGRLDKVLFIYLCSYIRHNPFTKIHEQITLFLGFLALSSHDSHFVVFLCYCSNKQEFVNCARRYNLPRGDFPPLGPFRQSLSEIKDISKFPKLDKSMVRECACARVRAVRAGYLKCVVVLCVSICVAVLTTAPVARISSLRCCCSRIIIYTHTHTYIYMLLLFVSILALVLITTCVQVREMDRVLAQDVARLLEQCAVVVPQQPALGAAGVQGGAAPHSLPLQQPGQLPPPQAR